MPGARARGSRERQTTAPKRAAWLTAGLLMFGAALPMARASSPSLDGALERAIRGELGLDVGFHDVNVDVDDGTAVLFGRVATEHERGRAETLARRTGVPRVDNRLEVDVGVLAELEGPAAPREVPAVFGEDAPASD